VIDCNNNGQGEYGFFGELSGRVAVRNNTGATQAISPPVLSTAFGKTSGPSAATRAGAGAAGATLASRAGRTVRDLAWIFSVALAVFCLPAVFVGEIDDLVAPLFIAYLALWLPLRFESKDD
jgi:hypothetical protein